jgi:tripartite-type tricarboxylate transporter receptor subunit TctC
VLLPMLDKKFPLDVSKEFVPISLSGQFQHTLIVKKEMPVNTVQELIAYLRANPARHRSARRASARRRTSPANISAC